MQLSQRICSDGVANAVPPGLCADPGGVSLYRNGVAVGGVGVEGVGFCSIDQVVNNIGHDVDERIALANLAKVEANGVELGVVNASDAPEFGFDVSAQHARTAAFVNGRTRGGGRQGAGTTMAGDADTVAADGISLDGATAIDGRAMGCRTKPFFGDGIDQDDLVAAGFAPAANLTSNGPTSA